VAQAQVLALDRVGVLALLARLDDPGERAKRRARHGVPPAVRGVFEQQLLDLQGRVGVRARCRQLRHRAELLGHHRQKLQPLEVEIHQLPQPVGTVEVGPFGAQDRQALAFRADLRWSRSTSRIAAWVRIVCE
jgi:hypothetical protein